MENIYKNYNNVAAHIEKPDHWQMDPSICKADMQKLPKKWSIQEWRNWN